VNIKFDPYQPDPKLCFGRKSLLTHIIDSALSRRCVLLFGGRQSGKTTALLRIGADLLRPVEVGKLDAFVCPVYVNLTALPINAQAPEFYNFLLNSAMESCISAIDGFFPSELGQCSTIEEFARAVQKITSSAINVDLTILFLIDEAERVLGERFPRGFQDNLFAILYGSELANDTKIAMVFSGAQGLYKFSEDETSPIGSRAAYVYMKNFGMENVEELIEELRQEYAVFIEKDLAACIFSVAGGHAGLTARLCQFVFENNLKSEPELRGRLDGFSSESRQLMRLWATSLSPQARALHDEVAHLGALSRAQVIVVFARNGWDPLLADRAIDELIFTGIAYSREGGLITSCEIYWKYIAEYLPVVKLEVPVSDKKSEDPKGYDLVWTLIEEAEIGLRSYINSVYNTEFGKNAEKKIEEALGGSALAKVRLNVDKSNKRYKYSAREQLLNIFDGLYLGQLGQLMMWKEAWPRFCHLTQDKRELELLLLPINSVRTDKAHFYKVPARELTRCKLHCEDLIGLVEKHRPKGTV